MDTTKMENVYAARAEYMKTVKAGDTIYLAGGEPRTVRAAVVTKATPSRISTAGDWYKRENGAPGRWSIYARNIVTPEEAAPILAEMEKRAAAQSEKNAEYTAHENAVMDRIRAAVDRLPGNMTPAALEALADGMEWSIETGLDFYGPGSLPTEVIERKATAQDAA